MGIRRSSVATTLIGLAFAFAEPGAAAQRPVEPATPLFFVPNEGQLDAEVRFQARVPGMCASVLADGFVLELASDAGEARALRVRLEGAAGPTTVAGLEPRAGRVHFLTGGEPEGWTSDVPTYSRVRIAGLRPGVDLELYERDGRLEYDLVLAAGADPAGLVLALEGAERAWIDERGVLACELGGAVLLQRAPLAWQPTETGERRAVACAWRALGDERFGFALEGVDRGAPLIVDPVLVYTTHVGGTNADEARSVAIDDEGAVYVTGWTRSGNFPLGRMPLDSTPKNREGVVFKLSSDGRELVWATYFGGAGDDEGRSIQVDDEGRVYVAGQTSSRDFPIAGKPCQRESRGGSDAFALCLAPDGASLSYATFLGGGLDDGAEGTDLGADGRLYVVGTTRSRDFPTGYQGLEKRTQGGREVFALLLDAHGALLAGTLFGGSEDDEGLAIDVDVNGCVYLAGRTVSPDFPTSEGAFDRSRSKSDAFVVKLDRACGTLLYSTLLGGSGHEEARGIAVDDQRRAVVCGWTDSDEFPAGERGTRAANPGRRDAFVAQVSESGHALLAVCTIGGGGADEAHGLVLDGRGGVWVVGQTSSRDFPGVSAERGGTDAFLVGFDAATWASTSTETFGGAGDDVLTSARLDPSRRKLALGGWADDLPLERRGPLAGKKLGPSDAMVLLLELESPPTAPIVGAARSAAGESGL